MPERDRFELDLAAALRAYLEDAPTEVRPVELARRFATAYPRRRAVVGRWGLGQKPAMAWVVLLTAALLAALVGGTLLIGSQLQRKLPVPVPPAGSLFECPPGSTPDKPGPVAQAGPPEGAMGMAFDRRAGRLVTVTSAGETVETWTFDVCTNTWAQMHPAAEPSAGAQLVYDIDSDRTILVSPGGSVWAYDLQANIWTEKGELPTITQVSLAYDPGSGLVVAAGAVGGSLSMWTYKVETEEWTPIQQANAGPGVAAKSPVIAYDASVDRIVTYAYNESGGEPETWLLDVRTGAWSRSSARTPGVVRGLEPPNIVYDEAARRTVITGNVAAAAYDASANSWETLVESEPGFYLPTVPMVYDAVNERLVGPGPYDNAKGVQVGRPAVFAFDPGAREWTVLLEPGEGQRGRPPAPTPAPTPARTPTP